MYTKHIYDQELYLLFYACQKALDKSIQKLPIRFPWDELRLAFNVSHTEVLFKNL